jgi:hypothetical protein
MLLGCICTFVGPGVHSLMQLRSFVPLMAQRMPTYVLASRVCCDLVTAEQHACRATPLHVLLDAPCAASSTSGCHSGALAALWVCLIPKKRQAWLMASSGRS